MQVGVGVGMGAAVGSALVPLSPSGWALSSSVPCFLTPTIILITTHPPRLTPHLLPLIIRKLAILIILRLGILIMPQRGILPTQRRGIHIFPLHPWRIIPLRGAVGIPITNLITLVEYPARTAECAQAIAALDGPLPPQVALLPKPSLTA